MVPLLSELAGRGHEVEVVVPPPFVDYVERVGLRATAKAANPEPEICIARGLEPIFARADYGNSL